MRTNTRLLGALALMGAVSLAGTARAAVIAGWDFSQWFADGALSIDGATFTDQLAANYSSLDSSFNAGTESANYGRLFFDGSFGSTNVDEGGFSPEFTPVTGSLSENINPGLLVDFDSATVLLSEGQAFANELSMTASQTVAVTFRATIPGVNSASNWSVTFAGATFGGSADVAVAFSADGSAFTPAGVAALTGAATAFTIPSPFAVDSPEAISGQMFVRLTLDTSVAQPIIDNVSISADSGIIAKGPAKCLNGLNKNYSGIFKKATQEAEKCSSDFANQKTLAPAADVLGCVPADRKGGISKAKAKNEDPLKGTEGKVCQLSDPAKGGIPPYGYSYDTPATDNGLVPIALGLQIDLLGNDPNLNVQDKKSSDTAVKQTATCQLAVQKRVNKLANQWFKEFVGCKKENTKSVPGKVEKLPAGVDSPANGPEDIAACINFDQKGNADPSKSSVTKLQTQIQSDIDKHCLGPNNPTALADGFGSGLCAGFTGSSAGFTTCASTLARQAAEEAIRFADGLF